MTGAVDDGHDANTLALSIGDDVIHLGFGQRVAVGVLVVGVVARGKRFLHGIAAVALAVNLHRHVVEEKTHAVVRKDQLDVGVAVLRGAVDDLLDLIGREILATSINRKDGVSPPLCGLRLNGRKRHANGRKSNRSDPCKQALDAMLYFVHVLSNPIDEHMFLVYPAFSSKRVAFS